MYLAEQPNMQGCKPAWREWKRRRSLIVLDVATDSNAVVMTRRSLRDHSPRHDHHIITISVSRRPQQSDQALRSQPVYNFLAWCLVVSPSRHGLTSRISAHRLNPRLNDGRQTLQATSHRNPTPVSWVSETRCHYTSPGQDVRPGDEGREGQMQRVNWHAIFDKRNGRLTSGYRFVQPIYRLSDMFNITTVL